MAWVVGLRVATKMTYFGKYLGRWSLGDGKDVLANFPRAGLTANFPPRVNYGKIPPRVTHGKFPRA